MDYRLMNVTSHPVVFRDAGGRDITYPPSGVSVFADVTGFVPILQEIAGLPVPVMEPAQLQVRGLPPPAPGLLYIVTPWVAQMLVGTRDDLVVPGTNPGEGAIRDTFGRVLAVTRLVRVAPRR